MASRIAAVSLARSAGNTVVADGLPYTAALPSIYTPYQLNLHSKVGQVGRSAVCTSRKIQECGCQAHRPIETTPGLAHDMSAHLLPSLRAPASSRSEHGEPSQLLQCGSRNRGSAFEAESTRRDQQAKQKKEKKKKKDERKKEKKEKAVTKPGSPVQCKYY